MPSELHTELIRRAEIVLIEVHQLLNGNKFQDVAFAWTGRVVKDDNGVEINDIVGCDLETNSNYHKTLLDMSIRTCACALMLVKKEKNTVLAVFETPEGSKSWSYTIERRGDVRVLGRPIVKIDTECLGLLWKKGMGTS